MNEGMCIFSGIVVVILAITLTICYSVKRTWDFNDLCAKQGMTQVETHRSGMQWVKP